MQNVLHRPQFSSSSCSLQSGKLSQVFADEIHNPLLHLNSSTPQPKSTDTNKPIPIALALEYGQSSLNTNMEIRYKSDFWIRFLCQHPVSCIKATDSVL